MSSDQEAIKNGSPAMAKFNERSDKAYREMEKERINKVKLLHSALSKEKSNEAALLTGSTDMEKFSSIEEIPYPTLEDDKIIVKAIAYAANPTDWKHAVFKIGTPGSIAGSDVSGIVEEVGKSVKGFEVGDVVSVTMHGNASKTSGAFAKHVLANPALTFKYPKSQIKEEALSLGDHPASLINTFEGAASVTLGLSTVGMALSFNLGIKPHKSENASKFILIWGGATATGILAIQVAKQIYGLKVITTASSKHHQLLKSLGADETFDYKESSVIEDIKSVANGKILYAFDTVSEPETWQQTYDATEGSENVSLDNLLSLSEKDVKVKSQRAVKFSATLVYLTDGGSHFGLPASAEIAKDHLYFKNELLTPHLKTIKNAPLKVLEAGLDSVNPAMKLLKNNEVNGEKIVFRS
ncbi:uncharacterized protein PRCAT00005872001 [Priceomyces carsonii]|uniref:uncharacterized protein n=1 Tax=Priceomyces carsonii TaxID=28549 RepID=UPI002ED7D050|nr:unnamed protein product [Priceomyces carsonii]